MANDAVSLAAQRATNGGRNQIINGQQYSQYSPQWYDAMRQDQIQKGTSLGQVTKAAYDAMGNPADTSKSSSDGSLAGIAGNLPPHVGGGSGGGLPGYE